MKRFEEYIEEIKKLDKERMKLRYAMYPSEEVDSKLRKVLRVMLKHYPTSILTYKEEIDKYTTLEDIVLTLIHKEYDRIYIKALRIVLGENPNLILEDEEIESLAKGHLDKREIEAIKKRAKEGTIKKSKVKRE